ncbi:hypothetical protein BpHYR1_008419 [Brachionus plicatilis]|uniref:Uncharacterized protein n=1 Tax=Brachionus plicatilis TaxID=10195 RepID=A0A3M7SB69_BRAPC|nr:hypothetical protein BpHYR1_008419 [Brachionus plicatilis]
MNIQIFKDLNFNNNPPKFTSIYLDTLEATERAGLVCAKGQTDFFNGALYKAWRDRHKTELVTILLQSSTFGFGFRIQRVIFHKNRLENLVSVQVQALKF